VDCSAQRAIQYPELSPGVTEQSPAQNVRVLCLVHAEIPLVPVTQLRCVQACFSVGADDSGGRRNKQMLSLYPWTLLSPPAV